MRILSKTVISVHKPRMKSVPGIEMMGDPLTSIVAFKGINVDILKVGDILNEHGWHLTFTQYPPGFVLSLFFSIFTA